MIEKSPVVQRLITAAFVSEWRRLL